MDAATARTMIRLSGGRLLPPVGSMVDVHVLTDTRHGVQTSTLAIRVRLLSVSGSTLQIEYDRVAIDSPVIEDFVVGRSSRFLFLPTELPEPCPDVTLWPRLEV